MTINHTVISCMLIAAVSTTASATDLKTTAQVSDVAMQANGDLVGAVLTAEGRPKSGQTVQILHQKKVIVRLTSDGTGRYRIRGLKPGIHTVQTAHGKTIVRLWKANTAPPNARKGIVSVDSRVVRGQASGLADIGAAELLGMAAFGAVSATTYSNTLGADDYSTVSSAPTASP